MTHLEHYSPLLDMRNKQSSIDNTIPSGSNTMPIRNDQTSFTNQDSLSAFLKDDRFQVLLNEIKLQRELFQQTLSAMQATLQVASASPAILFGGFEHASTQMYPSDLSVLRR